MLLLWAERWIPPGALLRRALCDPQPSGDAESIPRHPAHDSELLFDLGGVCTMHYQRNRKCQTNLAMGTRRLSTVICTRSIYLRLRGHSQV